MATATAPGWLAADYASKLLALAILFWVAPLRHDVAGTMALSPPRTCRPRPGCVRLEYWPPAGNTLYILPMEWERSTVFGVGVIVAGSLITNAVDSAKHPLGEPPIGLAGVAVNSTVSMLHWAPTVPNTNTGEEIQGPPFDVRPGSGFRQL